jgi:hypothetical protein
MTLPGRRETISSPTTEQATMNKLLPTARLTNSKLSRHSWDGSRATPSATSATVTSATAHATWT